MKNYIFGVLVSIFTMAATATESTYAGQETRNIKALSQQDVEGYLNGKGLGFAKTAELNNYPGPGHVLDLVKELSLTENQIVQTKTVFDDMKIQAMALGTQLVKKELELDQMFSGGSIDSPSLKLLLSDIGALQTQLRYLHLNAHLKQNALLTTHQIQLYNQLRGYTNSHSGEHNHSG